MIKNILNLGDAALYCDFGNEVNQEVNSNVIKYFYNIKELNIEGGQTIIDVGCGGGQLVEAISLGVGVNGKAIGVDPSETQIVSAKDRCQSFENTEFLCCYADEIDMDDASCDSITSTQTLEYIEDVDAALNEIRRLLKNHSRFVNISTLWDYFGFHGPDKKLNSLMHEVVKGPVSYTHLTLPTKRIV